MPPSARPSFTTCHDATAPGDVLVTLTVAPDGALTGVRATGPEGPSACVQARLAAFHLAPAADVAATTLSYRVTLSETGAAFSAAIVLGALDKAHIARVIKGHMGQIRAGYEGELTKDPTLAGSLTVKFVVAKDGTVSSATTKASTLGNEAVARCVNAHFLTFEFAAPRGGRSVTVRCPFLFSPSGARVSAAAPTLLPASGGAPAGSLDLAEVGEVLESGRTLRALGACYRAGLRRDPSLEGELAVRLVVAEDGTVRAAKALPGRIEAPAFAGCVEEAMRRVRFPPPQGDGEAVLRCPFVFTPP